MIHSIKIEDNRKSAVHYIAELPQFANGTAYDFKESVAKTLDQCQRQKIALEQEVYRLRHRNWWQRLLNKGI